MTHQHPITPSNLSPQAWAVLEAAYQAPDGRNATRQCVAAALRAAADHVDHDWSGFNCVDALCEIAAELEAQ
jgi:hypothetical protein